MMAWLKWSEMNWLRLLEGPGHCVILPIAPSMKRLTYKGERYFRMPDTRTDRRGTPGTRSKQGGCYLWDRWWGEQLAKAREQKARDEAASDTAESAPVPAKEDRGALA